MAGLRGRGRDRFAGVGRLLGYRPFLVLLGLGVLVRLAAMVLYSPAWLQSLDELRFSSLNPVGLFNDMWSPVGFTAVAAGLREIVPELWVTIAVLHLVGLTIGVSLFLAFRWLGVKPWVACIPAGVAFLSGDQVWIEHQIVAETFMTAALAAGLACAVRGLVPRVDLRWLAVASALLMYAGLCRTVAFAALPVLAVAILFWVKGSVATYVRALAAALVPALVLLGVYVGAFEASGGKYMGLTDMSGWYTYARAAPFADCSRFTPPEGTARLCESTPESERDGSIGYQWDESSRGRQVFNIEPATSDLVGSFGREAIIHEPLSYLKAVVVDLGRYVDPSIGEDRPFSGLTHEIQSFANNDIPSRELLEEELSRGYQGTKVDASGGKVLGIYQELFRISGLLIVVASLLTLIGMVVARGTMRLGVFLFGATGFLLYLVPVMTFAYEVRYGIPPVPFVVASGVLGAVALAERLRPSLVPPSSSGAGNGRESPVPRATVG